MEVNLDLSDDESIIARFESDVGVDGRYGVSQLIITNKRCIVCDDRGRIVNSIDLSSISSVNIVDYVGNSELKLILKDGRAIHLIRFTKSLRREFNEAANLIENASSTRAIISNQRGEQERTTFKMTPLLFVLRFALPYKLALILGIASGIASIFLGLLPPYYLRILIDDVILGQRREQLIVIIVIIVVTQALSSMLGAVRSYTLSYVSLKVMYSIRVNLFKHIMRFQPNILDTYESGRLISRITDDASRVNWFLSWGLEQLLRSIISLASVATMIFALDPRLAMIASAPLPLLILGVSMFSRKARWVYHYEWRRSTDVSALLVDVIPGFTVVKAYCMEGYEEDRLKTKLNEVVKAGLKSTILNLKFFPMLGFAISSATAIIWWVGGLEVLGGRITLGVLSAFISYVSQFYGPIQTLISMVEPMKRASTAAERIQSLMSMEPSIKDSPNSIDLDIRGWIKFENVWFGYTPYTNVLKNINFEIKPGEKVGIVGPTGSGKTTITKLLLRFYDVSRGRILLDGVDIRDIRIESLRRQIGIVSQDPRLFNDSISNNIRYGKPDATPEEVMAAAKIALAHDFILEKPLRYDTPCGEGGSMLSGGERQRIAIARTVISDPKILILDEATSSVDTITEDGIKKALDNIARGRTTIIIAHRLSTVKDVDKLIVLDKGEIVEIGTHEELLAKNGLYAKLWNTQFQEKPIETPVNP
ncbi:MAG: ABC transporter transmembrane domain-containing protein [Candidatus Bathyarchaeia archaeon]